MNGMGSLQEAALGNPLELPIKSSFCGEGWVGGNCPQPHRLHNGLATGLCPPTNKDAGIITPICEMGRVRLRERNYHLPILALGGWGQ